MTSLYAKFSNAQISFYEVVKEFIDMKISVAVFLITILASSTGVMKTRFKSVKCTVLNRTVTAIDFCFIKAYSRSNATLNLGQTVYILFGPPIVVYLLKPVKK